MRTAWLASLSVTALLLNGESLCSRAGQQKVLLATGSERGVYYGCGTNIARLAEACGVQVEVLTSKGSRENLLLLSKGAVQMCIAQSDTLHNALIGADPFSEPLTNIQGVATLFTEAVHVLVRSPLHLARIQDFRGKRVAVGPEGGGTALNARLILESAGISTREVDLVHLTWEETIPAISSKQIDGAFFTAGYPMEAVKTILRNKRATLLELAPELLERLVEESPHFLITYIPAGTYPNQGENISTIGVPAMLLTRSDVDSALIYAITKSLFPPSHRSSTTAIKDVQVPVHPGAKRYYEEAGVYSKLRWEGILLKWILPFCAALFLLGTFIKFKLVTLFFRTRLILRVFVTLFLIWLVGALVLYVAERKVNDYYGTLLQAGWSTVINWVNFGAKEPITSIGKITSVVMTVLGLGGIAWLSGELASIFIHQKLVGGKRMIEKLRDHYIIINWNDKGQGIIEALRNAELEKRPILIATGEREGRPVTLPEYEGVYHLSANRINEALIRKANVDRAYSIIVLADKTAAAEAADAETILVILTARKLCAEKNAKVPIVAELLDPQRANLAQYAGDLSDGSVEIVSSQTLCQDLITQVAVTPGLTQIYQDLLTFGAGTNEIYSLRLPKCVIGKTLDELFFSITELRKRDIQILPVAVSRGGRVFVNPNRRELGTIEDSDLLYAICDSREQLKELERELNNRHQPA